MSDYIKKRMEELGLFDTKPSSPKEASEKDSKKDTQPTAKVYSNYTAKRLQDLGLDKSSEDEDKEESYIEKRMRELGLDKSSVNVDKNYINSFIADVNTFLKNAETEYGGFSVSKASSIYDSHDQKFRDLSSRSGEISSYIQKNRDKISDESYNELMSQLDEINKAMHSTHYAFYNAKEYYSQWKTEYEYELYHEAVKKAEEDAELWNDIGWGYDPTKHSEQGQKGWDEYVAYQEQAAQRKAQKEAEKSFWEKLGEWVGDIGSDSTLPVHLSENIKQGYKDAEERKKYPDDRWTEEEKRNFGYIWDLDKESAYSFASALNNKKNVEQEKQRVEEIQGSATDNFWSAAGHTIGAIFSSSMGLADWMGDLYAMDALGYIPEADGELTPFEYSQAVTSGISNHLNTEYGTLDEDIPVIGGKGWGDAYSLGTSIAQSSLTAATGGKTFGQAQTLIAFFGSGAAASVDDAKRRGASDEQALAYGTMVGLAEGLSEMLGVDNLMKIKSSATMKQLMGNILKQAVAEGLEEGISTTLSNFADQLVMGDKSNFNILVTEFMAQGMSEEEAKEKAWLDMAEDLAYDMVGGFVSGGVHAGPKTTGQYVAHQIDTTRIGKSIMQAGGVPSLKQLANDVAGVSEGKMQKSLTKQAGKVTSEMIEGKGVGKAVAAVKNNINANRVGRLFNAVQTVNTSENNMDQNIRDSQNDVALGRIAKAAGVSVEEVKRVAEGTATPVAENGTESHYEVSADGKTILKSDPTKEVNIKGISSIENGRLVLETEDGTVDSSDLDYASRDEALVYESVANLEGIIDTATANKLSKHLMKLGGATSNVYVNGIVQAYTYGYYGYGREAMLGKNTLSSTLTEAQRNVAYGLGEQYRNAKTEADQAIRKNQDGNKPSKPGKVHFEGDQNALTERQRESLTALEKVADVLGVQIYVFESKLDEKGRRVGANGWYDPKDGSIHIDLHAGINGDGTMLFTAAHELTHFIRQWSPAKFKILADFLIQEYGKKGVSVDALVREQMAKAKRNGRTISYDTAYEEVIADSMEAMLSDGKVMEKLAKLKAQDKSLWKKIKDFINELAAKIRAVYEGLSPDSVEGRYVAEMVDSIEKLQELFTEGLVNASENYQMVEKNTTEDGGVDREAAVKRSDRIVDQIRSHLDEIMALDSVYTIDSSNATPYTANRKTDEKSGHAVFKEQGGIANRPGFGRVVLSKRGAVHTIHHGNGPAKQAAFPAIKAVVEQGIEIYRDNNHDDQGYDTVTFSAPITFFGEEAPLAVVVKSFESANADKTFYIHEICDAEGNYIQMAGESSNKKTSSTNFVEPTSTVSAADDGISPKTNIHNDGKIVKSESAEAMDIEVDEKTESVAPAVLMSERTWTESDYVQEREQAAKEIASAIGVSVKKAKAYIDSVNSIAKMIAEDRVRLDYFSSPGRSSFVGNVEYGGSFDFSTLCKKRRLLTGTFTAIQKALPNTALTADEILDIRNRMKDKGLEVSCGLCYVEGSRANMGQFAKEFLKLYKQYYPDAWQPNMADVNTPDGIEWVRINHPECYEQYEYFWNHYGTLKPGDQNLFASQQKPKLYQLHTEYKGEILDKFKDDDNVEEKNLNGGIRLQSFSDFEIVHLIDTMQIIMDMSRVGLSGQAYTKVPDFAWALGDTGLKINLSLIAKGVDENGKLIFDDVEGMPIKTAVELRNRYSKNVGTILVAFNDEQLLAAMADDRVDFIIPFHRSQWKKSQYEAMGLPAKTKDYTYMQNEKYIKPQYHEYRGRMVKDKASNYMPNEYWDFSKSGKENAEAYLEMCARNNKRPKFYKLLQNNGDGSYSLKADGSTDGYWKLLIDFKMYDNDGVGSPQMPVKPDFNMEEATRMLNDYSGGHSNFPVAQGIVDSFVKEYKDSHKGVKFSDRDYMDAVNRGDTESAKKMVDQFAIEQGFTVDEDGVPELLFHGTDSFGFTKIDTSASDDGITFWATPNMGVAGSYYEGSNYKIREIGKEKVAPKGEKLSYYNSMEKVTNAAKPFSSELGQDLAKMKYIKEAKVMKKNRKTIQKAADAAETVMNGDFSDPIKKIAEKVIRASKIGTYDAWSKTISQQKWQQFEEITGVDFTEIDLPVKFNPDKPSDISKVTQADPDVFRMMYYIGDVLDGINMDERGALKGQEIYKWDIIESYNDYVAEKGIYGFYHKQSNPFVYDCGGVDWNKIAVPAEAKGYFSGDVVTTRQLAEWAFDNGYDAIRLDNVVDVGGYALQEAEAPSTVWAFKNPESQLKSADPITYDDNGNVIPLSERFNTKNDDIRYSDRVTDKETLDFLNGQIKRGEYITTYKSMRLDDGKLHSPMAAEINGKYENEYELRQWYQAVEHPELIKFDKKNGLPYFELDKGVDEFGDDLGKVPARYNPYEHSSNYVINDQFKTAFKRSNLVVVEMRIPLSEITSGYQAQYAKDPVGWQEWKKGDVASALAKKGKERKVLLSRWAMPYRILSDSEVAQQYKELLSGSGVKVPNNVVTPSLLKALEDAGVDIDYEGINRFNAQYAKKAAEREAKKNGKVKYSDRDTESVSNRSLLANAFEGVAKNDIEKQKIQEYKGKIDLINAEERKLTELNEKIKELSFAKGPKDTKAIRDLQFEARQTANRISTYDKQLLRLEASKPLQDVLDREKKMAYKRAEQKGKDALTAYKEKSAKTQRELLEKWQESRKKGIESRGKTAMRHKVQSVVGELNQLLLSNDKKRHVPDSLKKAVADALALVNMDTVGAEERAAKYAALIAKETDPDKIDAYQVTMENILRQGDKMGQRLKELRDAYDEIQNSDDPDIANAYDPVIASSLKELSQSIGNTSLRNMSIEQLSDVYDMYRMVLTRVRDANKSFLNDKKEAISNLASRVVGEVRKAGGEHKYRAAMLDPVKTFTWNNLKPVYAMEHIGSATMTDAFNNVRKGEDTWAKDVTEARAYYTDKAKKYGYDSWDFKKKYRFKSASEMEFELTLEQILSLYAYSKREQAHDHLRLGGFVFDSNIETYKEKGSKLLKYKVNTADAHQITPEILASITGTLTKEQMAFVDEMQDYLSTVMGAKGNVVTMAMYGVKLFKEKFYFPLKSAKQFMFEQNEVSGEVKIKNSGFTNKVVAKANNPVILNNFMDVWANHVNDMSMYHAFVLPLEDFNRIFNYNSPKQEGKPPVSVKGTIQSAYSPAAVNYVKQLITDLNGGAMSDPRETFAKSMTAKFKKAKVFSSLSVVIQQPSAIGRAFALVDPKYFRPTKDGMNHDKLWAELKQYAPVAVIKEMGYFDTNMGRSTLDFIKAKEYSTFKEKAKAIFADSDYRDEILSKAPALADEMTWCAIWNAVKRETVAKHKDLRPGSEEFLKVAGERFTEVVTKTQVYDSVLARSANMRSKSGLMSMVTSFMAEPTTSINMLEDAIRKGKRGYKGYAAKAFASVAVSVILNNALVSLVYAGRDDDEDETFLEKYMQSFTSNMLDDINPITYYPFLKDMWSLLQGYDVERSDMSLISDIADALKGIVTAYTSEDGDVAEAWWDIAGAIANIGGVPMENIRRDVNGAINFFNTIVDDVNGRETTWGSLGDAIADSAKNSLPVIGWLPDETKADKLYDAIVSGDTEYVNRLKGSYKTEDSYHSAVRKALRENDPRIREAAAAWNANDLDEYMRIAKEIIAEKHFVQDDVVMAIRAEANALSPDEGTTSTSNGKGLFTAEKFASAIAQGDQATAYAIKTDIIQTAQKNGKTAEQAEKSFNSSAKSELKEMFLAGEISEQAVINALTTYCGADEDDALADVQYWEFRQKYPDVYADDSWFDKYYEEVADSGISIDMYMDYRNQVKDITGEGKKERRMAVIDSMPISSSQKDALYYAEGWTASKLYEAPWH